MNGCEATVTVPVGFSGAFIGTHNRSRLEMLFSQVLKFDRLIARKRKIEQELNNCNNPVWLARFSWELGLRDFDEELTTRASELEAKRAELLTRLETVREQLEQEFPGVAGEIESRSPASRNVVPNSGKRKQPAHRSPVAERNRLIRRYRDLPHLQMCHGLDDAFPPGASPARQLPNSWVRDFGVKSFVEAYRHPECRSRVHRLISGAKL